jgi:hypothetical protein
LPCTLGDWKNRPDEEDDMKVEREKERRERETNIK